MKYGTYTISLSIGYSNADREDTLTVSDYYSKSDWDELTEDEQDLWLADMTQEMLGQYIDYNYKIKTKPAC